MCLCLQVSVLYALQVFCHSHNFPKGTAAFSTLFYWHWGVDVVLSQLGSSSNWGDDGNKMDLTKLRRQRERQKIGLMSKRANCTCITPFFTFLCHPNTTTTWIGQILRSLDNGNGKAINSSIPVRTRGRCPLFSFNLNSLLFSIWATWYNREKVKGCEVYFSTMFSWTSPLSDRKVPKIDRGKRQTRGLTSKTTTLHVYRTIWYIFILIMTTKQIAICFA